MSEITGLRLKNFTAFAELDLSFSKGINILIGTNGTGKTHLLKVLYASYAITSGEDRDKSFGVKLRNVFSPYQSRIGRLGRRKNQSTKVQITVRRRDGARLVASFSNHTIDADRVAVRAFGWKRKPISTAYIPVKEMLAHAPGFLALEASREISFEEVYVDLIKKAYLPKLKGPTATNRRLLLDALQKAIDGKVFTKGEYFFLKNKQGDLEFSLLAEGMRKLALIWILIQNGTLPSGAVLFWDEPEANLNPSLMGEVVEVILELQRKGVQVFLSTHNHVLLKEFDLRKKRKDAIRYISLFRNSEGSVSASSCDDYDDIDPNDIAGTYANLYDREISRSLRK